MNNNSYSDFKNICRMCMLSCDVKFDRDIIISEVFYRLTDIHFKTNEELPQHVCLKCFYKIYEIHEFAFQCKRTHVSLLECLNNLKNPQIKEEPEISEEVYEPLKTEEEITIDENIIDFLKSPISNSTSECVIDELKIKKDVEDKNNELEENMIPGTSDDQNINSSKDVFLNLNIPNIKVQNKEESNNNVNLNDLNVDINSSNSSKGSNLDTTKKYSNDKRYTCDGCNKTFKYLRSLQRHLPNCKPPYECEKCSKSFKHIDELKNHRRTHSYKRHICEICFRSFDRHYSLKRHMRTHSGERPYKCEACSKTFSLLYSLKIHVRSHNGERPYKCEQCLKSFAQSYSLKVHMRTHNGERPFKCDVDDATLHLNG